MPEQSRPRITPEHPQSTNREMLFKGVRRRERGWRRLCPEWPRLLQSVPPLAARCATSRTPRKPSIHADELLGPPNFKRARTPRQSRLGEVTLRPVTPAAAHRARPPSGADRPAPGPRAALKAGASAGPGWKGL